MNYGGCVVVHQEAFVCYTHADDQLDGGRIQQMAKDLAGEFAAISGDTLVVVVDRSHLHVGDDWRDRLTEAVGNATFLLPFVTPRFFLSDECRRELEHFVRTAKASNAVNWWYRSSTSMFPTYTPTSQTQPAN
jgi:hypothetical protein